MWKIKYVDCIEWEKGMIPMARFEVTLPGGDEKSVRVSFERKFVHDYFRISGDVEVVKEKEELFKTWGLVKIEECIKENTLVETPCVTSEDFEWAAQVEKGLLQPASVVQSTDEFVFIPKTKIGFGTIYMRD